jgi:hypothetical protein
LAPGCFVGDARSNLFKAMIRRNLGNVPWRRGAICTAQAAAGADASAPPPSRRAQELTRLASEFGVELLGGAAIEPTAHGLGIVHRGPGPAAAGRGGPPEQRALVRVPLGLAIGPDLPGCYPGAGALASAPAALRGLLADRGAAWELRLAGCLLWACAAGAPTPGGGGRGRGGGGGNGGDVAPGFWRRYAPAALPPAGRQASLLLFGEAELSELQARKRMPHL